MSDQNDLLMNTQDITVLYVDDEDINLFLFQKSFEKHFNIVTATSGEEGLDKLQSHANDIIVVISDMRMPGMNGVEFIRKAKERFNNIAYYILTAFNFNTEIEEAVNEKLIDKFFTKPFDIAVIRAEVEKVAQGLTR